MPQFNYELDPPPGIHSDDSSYSASGRWVKGRNVRFLNGRPQIIGGWTRLFGPSDIADYASSFSKIQNMLAFNRSGTVTVAYGAAGINPCLMVGDAGATPSVRTPAAIASTSMPNSDYWSLAPWGSTLLAALHNEKLYEQSGTGLATEVTEAPDQIVKMLVTEQRQVMALGCNEVGSGTFNGLCIRVSDIEDYSSAGSWTPTATNNSDEIILEDTGAIVGAVKLSDYILVWTTNGLHLGQFIGDPGQSYRFDHIGNNCGLIAQNACTVLDGVAYWIAPNRQWFHFVPGGRPEAIPNTMGRLFSATLQYGAPTSICMASVPEFGEVWCWYNSPNGSGFDGETEDTDSGRYMAFSVRESERAREPVWFAGGHGTGRVAALADGALLGAHATGVLTADTEGNVFVHETTRSGSGGSPLSGYLESADQYIEAGKRRVMVRDIQTDLEDQLGNISLILKVRDRPGDPPAEKGPYLLTARAAGYVFSSAAGPIFSMTNATTATGGGWAGRPLTVAGVNEWANGADTGKLMRFTVTADFEGGPIALATVAPTPNSVDGDPDRNIVTDPVEGAAVTFLGSAGRRTFRASGRLISARFEFDDGDNGCFARWGRQVFDCVTMGER